MEKFISDEKLEKLFTKEYQSDFVVNASEMERSHPLMISETFSGIIILNKKITGDSLRNIKVQRAKFHNCLFQNCDLTGAYFWLSTFSNCKFEACNFEGAIFRKCEIDECLFFGCRCRFYHNVSESYIYNSKFVKCLYEGIEISGTEIINTQFLDSVISNGRYQANSTARVALSFVSEKYLSPTDKELLNSKEVYEDLIFRNCQISFVNFIMIDFIDVKFKSSEITKCSFTECKLHNSTLNSSNNKRGWGTNSIDLDSLIESPLLSQVELKSFFNISKSTQSHIKNLLKNKVLSSVFISYSLTDSIVAKEINKYLKNANVTTFLWEKDALGGKPLKDIMKSNIDSKDRLLFIASESSLKSEGCHFELTQGRKKQDRLWKTILIPIHIDSFLFEIQHEMIRPKLKRDEIWENILEIREINSLDFSEFKHGIKRNGKKFEAKMEKLIDSLKIQ